MIFRPFGAKKNKKNWIWKMTLADPPTSMEFSIIDFFNPSLFSHPPKEIKFRHHELILSLKSFCMLILGGRKNTKERKGLFMNATKDLLNVKY